MIQREYLTEYDEYLHGIRYSITISTGKYQVFKKIKAYADNVCEKYEDVSTQDEEMNQILVELESEVEE